MNIPSERPVLFVGGGKGGVGKSTLSAALARALNSAGHTVGVIDADLAGPSQSLLFDCDEMTALNGKAVPSRSSDGIRVVSTGLIARSDTALVWSDATATAAIHTLCQESTWSGCDVLVVDLPPGQGAVTMALATRFPHARAILVTTASHLALEECERGARFLRRMEIDLVGIIENMAFVTCDSCGHEQRALAANDVEEVAARCDTKVLASLPFRIGDISEHLVQLATELV